VGGADDRAAHRGPPRTDRAARLWAALGCALLTTLPEFLWQARHDWPLPPLPADVEQGAVGAPLTFLPLLLLAAGLVTGAAAACYGVARLLGRPELSRYAFLGWAAIGVGAAFLAMSSRAYYATGVFPVLWAAASADVARHPLSPPWRWLARWPALLLSGLLALPGAPGMPGWAGWPRTPVAPLAWLTRDDGAAAPGWRISGSGPGSAAPAGPGSPPRWPARTRSCPPASHNNVVIITRGVWGPARWTASALATGCPRVLREAELLVLTARHRRTHAGAVRRRSNRHPPVLR